MAACLPLDPKLMTPPRAALMILGGPAASLVLTHVGLRSGDEVRVTIAPIGTLSNPVA